MKEYLRKTKWWYLAFAIMIIIELLTENHGFKDAAIMLICTPFMISCFYFIIFVDTQTLAEKLTEKLFGEKRKND